MSTARSTTSADDDRVRVTTMTFDDGDETGRHRHAYDYIVVPITGGTLEAKDADGSVHTLEQLAGTPYFGMAGTEHNVVNRSGQALSFVEIELKH